MRDSVIGSEGSLIPEWSAHNGLLSHGVACCLRAFASCASHYNCAGQRPHRIQREVVQTPIRPAERHSGVCM